MRICGLLLLIVLLCTLTTCSDDESRTWKKLAPYPGEAQYFAPAIHNNNAYLFFGEKDGFGLQYSKSVWRYTSLDNEWTELSAFEGVGRSRSTAFAIDNSIYIVGGQIPTDDIDDLDDEYDAEIETDEVLKYDIITDSWHQLSPFPGGPTSAGIAFKLGDDIFYGFGAFKNRTLWKYSVITDEWIRKADFPGGLSSEQDGPYSILFSRVMNFVYDNKIFVVTCELRENPEMWQYDVLTNEWTQLTDLTFKDKYSSDAYFSRGGSVSYVDQDKCRFLLGVTLGFTIHNDAIQQFNAQTHEWEMTADPLPPPYLGSAAFLIYTGSELIVGSDYISRSKSGYELWKLKL